MRVILRYRSEWLVKDVFCHSERAILPALSFWTSFWARKNPYCECGISLMRMYLRFICDLPNERAGFFAIAQNDMSRGFLHYDRGFSFIVILNELLGEEESLPWVRVRSSENVIGFYLWLVQWVRGILHCVQNDIQAGFLSFWTSFWARKNPWKSLINIKYLWSFCAFRQNAYNK